MIKENVLRKNLLTNEIDCGNVDSEFEAENLNGNIIQDNPWVEISKDSDIYKEYTLSNIKLEKINACKAEASVRINKLYPSYKQINNIGGVINILNKENMLLKKDLSYELTTEDITILKSANDCKKYIDFIREKSNLLEDNIKSINDLTILQNMDISDDSYWI